MPNETFLASYLTAGGLVVLNKVIASTGKLEFTKAELGSGVCTGEAACRARTSLVQKITDASLVEAEYTGGEARISVQYNNTGLANGFFVNEVGLYVKDPQTNEDVLYCYSTFGDTPDWIAPASAAQYIRTYDIITVVTDQVTVTVNADSSAYCNMAKYNALKQRVDALSKGAKIYGIRWDKANAKCTRIFDAAGITDDVTNFCYRGSVATLNNPFDNLYPFSEFKQCNVNLTTFAALNPGQDIRDAVAAWFGDVAFKDDGTNGPVMAYRPEYWFTQYEDDGYRVFAVSEKEVPGWAHCKPYFRGYAFGVDIGSSKISCYDAEPISNVAVSTIHTYAGNNGMTLDDIYTYSAELTAMIVEYGTLDMQNGIGKGVSELYREDENDKPYVSENGATRVVLPIACAPLCVPGATLDFGASKGAVVLANRRTCTGYEAYGGSNEYISVNFKGGTLDVTTSMYVSFHGAANGTPLGDVSGYVGTNGKSNAFYRGAVAHGNRWRYTLGAYRESGASHRIWYCPETDNPDSYDALDKTKHVDSGLSVAPNGYIKDLGIIPGLGAIPLAVATGDGASSSNPVGDYSYRPADNAGATILFAGGNANDGAYAGGFCGNWFNAASYSGWFRSAVPVLK